MIRSNLQSIIESAVASLVDDGYLPSDGRTPVEISDTRDPSHGDFACNFALIASKAAGKNPRELAERLKSKLEEQTETDAFESIEVAGPGFLNLRLKPEWVAAFVPIGLEKGDHLATSTNPHAKSINVEYVSVNPNGPITVGSARGAAFGATLCNILEAAGHTINREYYINDGTNSEQMRQFADSVRAHLEGTEMPEKGYKGEYVKDVANEVAAGGNHEGKDLVWYQQQSQDLMLKRQRLDLAGFGVTFDTWFSEQSLHENGTIAKDIQDLTAKGAADEEPHRTKLKLAKGGVIEEVIREDQPVEEDNETDPQDTRQNTQDTLWLRSTKFGDDLDRVLRRKDGRLTYIASDISYHKDKFSRPPGADKLITILGPDHHGYIARLHAVLAAARMHLSPPDPTKPELNETEAKIYKSTEERDACRHALEIARQQLEVIIFQIVRFVKDGQPAPMRKRDGNIYELRDLITELGKAAAPNETETEQARIGRDVARFFFLMRSHDTHMDFDIDLATKQSDENPVFYAQYAHARICSILRKAEETNTSTLQDFNTSLLTHEKEKTLIKKICDLPHEVRRCAEDYGVHRLTTFAVELARTFHHFYDACRVIQPENPELTKARLALCRATQIALASTLRLIGCSAPEKMERATAA